MAHCYDNIYILRILQQCAEQVKKNGKKDEQIQYTVKCYMQ